MEPPGLRGFLLTSILILANYGVRSCKVTVQQDAFYEGYVSQKTVNLSCQYQAENCPNDGKIYWFRYLASEHKELYPKSSNRRFKTVHNDVPRYNTVLHITNISVQDSGIYICGIAFPESDHITSKTTGPGTILQVRDVHEVTVTPANAALIVICTLLFIYSITVFSYYAFRAKWRICQFTENKHGSREATDNQVIEDDTIYQNT